MENNLSLVGFVASYSGLQEAENANHGKYSISEFELSCWKIEVLDGSGNVVFICRK